jgi:hypothetical protein
MPGLPHGTQNVPEGVEESSSGCQAQDAPEGTRLPDAIKKPPVSLRHVSSEGVGPAQTFSVKSSFTTYDTFYAAIVKTVYIFIKR